MKILHTSDWHVGKVLKGRSRADEHDRGAARAGRRRPRRGRRPGHRRRRPVRHRRALRPRRTKLVTRALTALRGTGATWWSSPATTTTPRRSTRRPCRRAGHHVAGPSGGRRARPAVHSRHDPAARLAAGRAAVPVPAVRGARAGDVRADRGRGQPDLRRPRRPAGRRADRGLRRAGHGQPGHRPPDRGRRQHRRRRARGAHDPRLRRAGRRSSRAQRALRGAGPPAPARSGCRAPARCATAASPARGRLRRGGEHAAVRCWSRCSRRRPAAGPRGARDGGHAAAHGAGHPGRARRDAERTATPGCGCSSASSPGPGCARRCRSCCPAPWRSGSTRRAVPGRGAAPAGPQRRRGRSPRELFARLPRPTAATPTTATLSALFDQLLRRR